MRSSVLRFCRRSIRLCAQSPHGSPILGSQPQFAPGQGDVGAAAGRVVGRQWLEDDVRGRAGDLQDEAGQLQHGAFVGVPDVHRPDERRVEQGDQSPDLVLDEAQAPRLAAVPVHGQRLVPAAPALCNSDDAAVAGGRRGP